MPPFFPEDFAPPSTAVALVGSSLYGEQWNGCPTLSEARSLYNAIDALRNKRTIARQHELWPALSASSRVTRRRARVLELSAETAAKRFVSLGDSDRKAIADEIEAKFAEDLARERHCQNAKTRLLVLFCSAQVTTTLLASNGKTYEMPCEFWASDQAGSAVDSGEASYNPAIYDKSEPFETLQGRVLVPKADLIVALEGAPDVGAARSAAVNVDASELDQTESTHADAVEIGQHLTAEPVQPKKPLAERRKVWADRLEKSKKTSGQYRPEAEKIAGEEGLDSVYIEREARRVRATKRGNG